MSLVPGIGEEYAGSIIVDIKEEDKDVGDQIRHRKYVTLKNGLIVFEDIMEDKIKMEDIQGEYKELKYDEVEYPEALHSPLSPSKKKLSAEEKMMLKEAKKAAKAAKKAEDDAKWEAELEKRRQAEQEEERKKKEARLGEAKKLKQQAEEVAAKKKAQEEAEAAKKKAEEEAAAKKKAEEEEAAAKKKAEEEEAARKKAEAEEAARKKAEEKKWKPQRAMAYSSKDPDAPAKGATFKPRAVWQTANDAGEDEHPDEDCWKPQDLLLYAPGKEPEQADDSLPKGSWCYAPGAPASDRPDGWRPSDVIVYPPGRTPPADVKPDGVYTYAPKALNKRWPPPVDETKKMQRILNSLPAEFRDKKPVATKVQPKSRGNKNKNSSDLNAVWAYPKGKENDDNLWKPQELWIYAPGEEPKESPRPQGVWGYAPGSEPDPKTGEWNKKDILVYAPGTEPDDDVKPQGKWEYSPDSKNTAFPPPIREPIDDWQPQAAWVYPKAKCPKHDPTVPWKPQGIWTYHKNPMVDNKWRPQELWAYAKGQEPRTLDKGQPHGVWGLSPDAEPDENGNWKPEDMWFYAPGEEPPDDGWRPQGIWTYPPQKLKIKWPPPTGKYGHLRDVGKLKFKPKGQPNDWKPQGCYVGRRKKPSEDDSGPVSHPKGKKPLGVWKFPDDKEPEKVPEWMSKKVSVYPPGEELPESADTSKPHGVWGFSPDAEPDDDGEWNPNDIWFVAPGETPPDEDEWIPAGVWSSDVEQPKFKPKGQPDDWKPQNVVVGSKGDDDAVGVWKFGSGGDNDDDDDDDEWRPSQVCMYPPGENPENADATQVKGVWGFAPDAEPDDDGEWNPSNVWFIGPDDTPPDDDEWEPQGVWTSDEKKPPKFRPNGETSDDWEPQDVEVGKGKDAVGIWKFGGGGGNESDDDDDWKPRQVRIHPPGKDPENIDEKKPHGVWGMAPGAEPDENGNFQPKDVWFFGSGETPPDDDEWVPHGVWISKEEKPKKKPPPKKVKSPKKKKPEEKPKKKSSYLPDNWKEQQSQFGQITTKTYVSDYSDSANVLVKTGEETQVVELKSPQRRSEKKKIEQMAAMAKLDNM